MRKRLLLALWGVSVLWGCERTTKLPPRVVINEVMARNASSGFTDPNGLHLDWVEVYNPTGEEVPLGGYTLTDNPQRPEKYRFPANLSLAPGGFVVVFLVGASSVPPPSGDDDPPFLWTPLHADFGISGDSDAVYLFARNGLSAMDRAVIRCQPADVSNGRYPDGSAQYGTMYAPSPLGPNRPIAVAPARWRVPPTGPCDVGPDEEILLEFTIAQDASEPLPEIALGFRVVAGDCDLESEPGALVPRPVLLVSETEYDVPCDSAVNEEAPCDTPPGCRRDVEGNLVPLVRVRERTYRGFLPPASSLGDDACGTTILWQIEVDDGLRPLLRRECFTYCEGCAALVVNEYQPRNSLLYWSYERVTGEVVTSAADWLEVHNFGNEPIEIARYALVGRGGLEGEAVWTFGGDLDNDPSTFGGRISRIEAGEYIVVLADDDDPPRVRTYYRSDASGNPVPEDTREYFSTRFRLDPDRATPDTFTLIAPSGRIVDHVILDFSANPPELGGPGDIKDDLSVGRFEDEGFEPNALRPGTVTICPTPGLANTRDCELEVQPTFGEVVLVEPRCPAADQPVVVTGRLAVDSDTGDAFDVRLIYSDGTGETVLERGGGLDVFPVPPQEQLSAPVGSILYALEAVLPGLPDGTLVTFFLEARDNVLGTDWVLLGEETSPEVSFRYLVGGAGLDADLQLSEVLPRNESTSIPGFESLAYFPDYAELRYAPDASAETVDLSGFYLAQENEPGAPIRKARRWRVPDGTFLERGGRLLFVFGGAPPEVPPPVVSPIPPVAGDPLAAGEWPGGSFPASPARVVHVDTGGFALNRCKETLYLVAPDHLGNCVVDGISWDLRTKAEIDGGVTQCAGVADQALGRIECLASGETIRLASPTPGASNTRPVVLYGVSHTGIGASSKPNECVGAGSLAIVRAAFFVDRSLVDVMGGIRPVLVEADIDFRNATPVGSDPTFKPLPATAVPAPPGYRAVSMERTLVVPSEPLVEYRVVIEDVCGSRVEPCAVDTYCFSMGTAVGAGERPLVRINEINRSLALPGGAEDERTWIELYNPSSVEVSLGGLSLSANPWNPREAVLPAGIILPPGTFLLVITDGGPPLNTPDAPPHLLVPLDWAKFERRLEETGTVVTRCREEGTLSLFDRPDRGSCALDAFTFDYPANFELCDGVSLGRVPDGADTIEVLEAPSPGEPNTP